MKSRTCWPRVFPDQVACAENLAGEREIPDHPLVAQTLHDCLHEAMDVDGWLRAAAPASRAGEVEVRRARPDRAVAARRRGAATRGRTRSSTTRRSRSAARRRCRAAATPTRRAPTTSAGSTRTRSRRCARRPGRGARNADEMHEALIGARRASTDDEAARDAGWHGWLRRAGARPARDAARCRAADRRRGLWVAAERLAAAARAAIPRAVLQPAIEAPAEYAQAAWTPRRGAARTAARAPGRPRPGHGRRRWRSRCGCRAPTSRPRCCALQSEGYVLQGRFTRRRRRRADEWCERHLLARIHRYTLKRLRREIEPVEPRDFMRFLFDWQHVGAERRVSGPEALAGVLAQLEGFEAPAAPWEAELLPARVDDYASAWLDDLCTAGPHRCGRGCGRRRRRPRGGGAGVAARDADPAAAAPRSAALWTRLAPPPADDAALRLARAARGRLPGRARRLVLRRDRRRRAPAAHRTRGRAGRAGRARPRPLRQLRRPARAAGAGRRSASSAHAPRAGAAPRCSASRMPDAGRWSGRAGDARRARRRAAPARRCDRARRAHAAAPLRRRVLAPARARGRVAAAVARPGARLPPARGARRDPRRPLHRRPVGRAVRAARSRSRALRQVRRRPADGALVCLSAADPANLLGTVLPGTKVPRVAGARVLYADGVPLATSVAGEIEILVPLDADQESVARKALTLSTSVSGLPAWPLPSPRARALPHSD